MQDLLQPMQSPCAFKYRGHGSAHNSELILGVPQIPGGVLVEFRAGRVRGLVSFRGCTLGEGVCGDLRATFLSVLVLSNPAGSKRSRLPNDPTCARRPPGADLPAKPGLVPAGTSLPRTCAASLLWQLQIIDAHGGHAKDGFLGT